MKKLQLLLGVALLVASAGAPRSSASTNPPGLVMGPLGAAVTFAAAATDHWSAPVTFVPSSSSGIGECERWRKRA